MTSYHSEIVPTGWIIQDDMQDSEKMANWLENQVTRFDALLRKNFSKNIKDFGCNILSYICHLTRACHGVFYIKPESEDILKAITGYSCVIKEGEEQVFEMGEGLIGQVACSQKELYFENLKNYCCFKEIASVKVKVASLFFLPLVFNQQIYGVLELAYFHNLEPGYQEFMVKISKSIAITMESILNHSNTEKLLAVSQEQKELLNEREEELKQNLEEIKAIHEVLQDQNKQISHAYSKLAQSNASILESIRYAKRIQEAILPSSKKLKNAWSDYYVIYHPKDIVSGDFYWYLEIKNKKFVGVIDCTGHGVPGAFMSMIAHTLLNQIVMENEVYEPNLILNLLHQKVQDTIRHDASKSKDGMDLMLCSVEETQENQFKISFAGAKCNLYYTNNDKLYLIKGDRKSIGESTLQDNLDFTNYEIQLCKGDILYMTTDGLIDICNTKRKRFGKKRLAFLLNKIMSTNFSHQEKIFNEVIKSFQQGTDQRDDITLLTVRL